MLSEVFHIYLSFSFILTWEQLINHRQQLPIAHPRSTLLNENSIVGLMSPGSAVEDGIWSDCQMERLMRCFEKDTALQLPDRQTLSRE